MKNVSYDHVDLTGGFWHDKQLQNETITIDSVFNRFADTGRIEAFAFNWKEGMKNKPHIFWDSDVAKWMEGAAYILKKHQNTALQDKVEYLIDCIEKNQGEDGYFNIYFTVCEPEKRFTDRDCHELYCAGHLIEAAVAYSRATGRDRFLNCMIKYVDCIEKAFITDKTAAFTTPGHEEIELALVKLYRHTGDVKYLNMSRFFVDNRGVAENDEASLSSLNTQSHLPVRQQKTAEGHAVRACYLYAAMADLALELNDKALFDACKCLFNDIIHKKMYITGGIGSTFCGEAFTVPYDLPNDKAYAETCASIAMMFFSLRMQRLENHSIYADIIERELYNGIISGLSLDAKSFFYDNPLEINLQNYTKYKSSENKERYAQAQRVEVFECSCCPPNLNRVLSSLSGYIYGYEDDAIYVNQFMSSKAEINGMTIECETDYPINGKIKLVSSGVQKLYVRIPSWCKEFEISCDYVMENGYACITSPEKCVEINLTMTPVLLESNIKVQANSGKAAVQFGPVVYCAESCDNTENLYELFVDKNLNAAVEYSEFFKQNVLTVDGFRKITGDALYAPYSKTFEPFRIKMIPYAGFANRGESNMCVWLNVR